MLIFVRSLEGTQTPVEVDANGTVEDLFEGYKQLRGAVDGGLFYQDKPLCPKETLADSGVCPQSVVEHRVKPAREKLLENPEALHPALATAKGKPQACREDCEGALQRLIEPVIAEGLTAEEAYQGLLCIMPLRIGHALYLMPENRAQIAQKMMQEDGISEHIQAAFHKLIMQSQQTGRIRI